MGSVAWAWLEGGDLAGAVGNSEGRKGILIFADGKGGVWRLTPLAGISGDSRSWRSGRGRSAGVGHVSNVPEPESSPAGVRDNIEIGSHGRSP